MSVGLKGNLRIGFLIDKMILYWPKPRALPAKVIPSQTIAWPCQLINVPPCPSLPKVKSFAV
jgi:hypothetical protein